MNTKRSIIILTAVFFACLFFLLSGKKVTHAPQHTQPSVTINGHTFLVELAQNEKERERGLSYRPSLAQDHGMLFIFDKPDTYSFWMKEMHFPLDMVYIKDETIVAIFENVPPPASPKQTLPIYTPDSPANKVLEINAGLSKKYAIKKGDKIEIKL